MDDVFDDEREKSTFTINEYLDDLEERELEAEMVLGGDDGDECTYPKGYLKRQAIFSCLTCTPDGNAGVCTACSISCHEGHEVLELWTKRNFRCDCGNSKFGNFICKLQPNKDIENAKNSYNHNFKGTYCTCNRPYPDPDVEEEEEMIQCCVCEDWFHREHLGLDSGEKVPMDDEGEPLYDELICQHCATICSFLTLYPQHIFITPNKHELLPCTEKGKAILEETPSDNNTASTNIEPTASNPTNPTDIPNIESSKLSDENKQTSSKTTENANLDTTCKLGIDFTTMIPIVESSKAMFLKRNWRDELCGCVKCLDMYKEKGVGFLIDKDESIAEYERKAKERRDERLQKQEGATMNMLNNLGHVEKVEIMSGIADMKNEMANFFANRDASQVITPTEIYQLFDNLKKKRRREM